MAQYTTEGIVIGGSKFSEADRILRILTKDRGKISAIAKGVRRGKSKFSGCLEPMMVNTFLLAEGRNMDIVCQAENIRSYSRIRDNYSLITSSGNLLEAAGKLTEEGLRDSSTYELLLSALDALDGGASPHLVELIFKTKLLREHGVFPELAGCSFCGKVRTKAIHFDGAQMAFLCDACAKGSGIYHPVSKAALEGLYKASQIDAVETAAKGYPELPGDNDEAVHLADEMLSAFLQAGVGRAREKNKRIPGR
jgi:DNA repair protein RecO (recombination protein O)